MIREFQRGGDLSILKNILFYMHVILRYNLIQNLLNMSIGNVNVCSFIFFTRLNINFNQCCILRKYQITSIFLRKKRFVLVYRGIKILLKYICAFTTLAHTHYTTQFYVYNITNPSSYYHPHLPLSYFRMQQ